MNRLTTLLLVAVLALGLAVLTAVPGPAAEQATPEQIAKLITQLGSDAFEEREKANEQLDAIGLPALEALKKAAKSEEVEVRRRAEDLITKIEKRGESVRILAPKKVHLVYKDTPLKDALDDFKKKSGYAIALADPRNQLKDRKITLDTGEVTFWEAMDQFCVKAGLAQASVNDLMRLAAPPAPALPLAPGAVPIRANPVPGAKPVPAQKIEAPADKPGAEVKPKPPVQAQPARAVAQVQIKAVAPAILPVAPPRAVPGVGLPLANVAAHQITLIDAKPQPVPTDARSAVRVRYTDYFQKLRQAPAEGTMLVGLQLTGEPRLQLQHIVGIRVTKAIDDQDQKLTAMMNMGVNAGPIAAPGAPAIAIARPVAPIGGFGAVGGFGGFGMMPGMMGMQDQYGVIVLKMGEKASKKLKELSGVATVQVLTPAQIAISADNVLKAAGKTFKGKEGGHIKIIEATKGENGQYTVRFELEAPPNTQPANANGPGGAIFQAVPGQFVPVPLPAPGALPAPPPQGKRQLRQQGAQFQVQAQPAQAQAQPVQVQIQIQGGQVQIQGGNIQIGGIGGFGMPMMPGNGIDLVDEKGGKLQIVGFQQRFRNDGNGPKFEQVLTFQAGKGQGEPAKLTYSASKSTAVDVPFTLKDVPLQ